MTESWKGYEGLNLRHAFASLMGKLAAAVVRRTGRGGGTAAPGLVAERLSPAYLYDLLAEIPGGHALISGTNGKTTSAAMVGAMLEKDGREVVRNRSGSNLTRGLLSELLGTTDWRGRLRANAETAGVFEVDEAALVRILPRTRPRAVLLTNLFRDQLDRYGELDTITRRWQAAIGDRASVAEAPSTIGGGSLPGETLPSWTVSIAPRGIDGGAEALSSRLRSGDPAVLGRIEDERVILDSRTVLPEQDEDLLRVVGRALAEVRAG